MDILLYNQLNAFRGRRNTVLTLFVPAGHDVQRFLDGLGRQIRAIKHVNKRQQAIRALRLVRERVEGTKQFKGNGRVICAGYSLEKNEPLALMLEPPAPLLQLEYYYDYVFHMARLQQVFQADVVRPLVDSEESEHVRLLERLLSEGSNRVAIGPSEINEALLCNAVDRVYTTTVDAPLSNEFLALVRSKRTVVHPLRAQRYEQLEPFGTMFAMLYFSLDVHTL